MSNSDFIPVNTPDLTQGNEKKYLVECIETGWISSEGPFVLKLEQEMAKLTQRKHGVAVCNGTAALELVVRALRIGKGDEVILPSLSIISCSQAVYNNGATIVPVDSSLETFNMDVRKIEELITSKTRAIMVVHTYGLPVDMDTVMMLAKKHSLYIIEDAAEMHGQFYKGRPCGSFGDISIFSFYPNKHVTTGEGGMVLCNDDALAERCRLLRNLAFSATRFVHEELGWNFRMSNLQAAVGVAQLEKLDRFVTKKRNIGDYYNKKLSHLTESIQLPIPENEGASNIYWVYTIVIRDHIPLDASQVMKELADLRVGTRPFFWPVHEQPVFIKEGLFKESEKDKYPHASFLARKGFYVPSGLALTLEDQDRVISALDSIFAKYCSTNK